MAEKYVYGTTTGFDTEYAAKTKAKLTNEMYDFEGQDTVITPAIVFYKDYLEENVDKVIEIAGGTERLWPHMKSHKMEAVLKLMMAKGIKKFKCATIAEAEVAAKAGAEKLIIAYPQVGPNIQRLVDIQKAFPDTEFFAIGEDRGCLEKLSKLSLAAGIKTNLLVDVNSGLNRTGVELPELEELLSFLSGLSGIVLRGLHWYDAQFGEGDAATRTEKIAASNARLAKLFDGLREKYPAMDIIAMGGSPEFAYHADFDYPYAYLCPGTILIQDWGYTVNYPDMQYKPAGVILTRVISNAKDGYFTLDVAEKSISVGNKVCRGIIVGLDNYEEVFMNEEHWVFRMKPGFEKDCPKVGAELHVVPTHICPCSQLHPRVPFVENGKLGGYWEVSARDRKITY